MPRWKAVYAEQIMSKLREVEAEIVWGSRLAMRPIRWRSQCRRSRINFWEK